MSIRSVKLAVPEDERERVRTVVHVELPHAELEPFERDAVLAAEPQCSRVVWATILRSSVSEPRLRARQCVLEDAETSLLGAHARLQLADATRDRAELLGQDAGAAIRVGGLPAQAAEVAVDACLLRPRIAGSGAGEQEAENEKETCDGSFEAGATTHQPDFAPSARAPSIPSSLRSASAASRRTTPITAR